MIELAPANKAVKSKDIPYSNRRVYVANKRVVEGIEFNHLPSGTEYVRMPDGSLRRVKEVRKMEDGKIGVKI